MNDSLVFFGTGPVAAEALKLLVKNFKIEAVVTKPQPEHHKGDFPVLAVAKDQALKVLYAANKQELSELFSQKPVKSQLGLVIDYGVIISRDVIDYLPLGIVNSHFSLLPEWRGADPISFAVLSGQEITGVSLMLINERLDEGSLLAQAEYSLPAAITTPELTEDLTKLSDDLLVETLPKYIAGEIRPYSQPSDGATYSRKLTKDDSLLIFKKPAEDLEREVRAFLEWPRSRAKIGDIDVVITAAHVNDDKGEAGQIFVKDNQLGVHTSKGSLMIDRLIPAGKNEMSAAEFLRGYKIS